MSIGSITSTGKQNAASGSNKLYLAQLHANVYLTSSNIVDMYVYCYISQNVASINDLVDYIFEKGFQESATEYSFCCIGHGYLSSYAALPLRLSATKNGTNRQLRVSCYVTGLARVESGSVTSLTVKEV